MYVEIKRHLNYDALYSVVIENTLKEIGLTDGEIRVYLSLLETGSTTTGKITKKSNISGSKVYEVLDRLISKGLVSFVTKNGVRYFESATPEKLLTYLEEKKEKINKERIGIQKIIPDLILKQKRSQSSEIKVFTGFEGIKTCNEDILSTLKRNEEWLSMGLSQQPKSWELYFNKRQIYRSKRGILHKHLLNEQYKSLYKSRKKLRGTEFRFLPRSLEMPTSIEIYNNKVLILILLEENPMGIMIESHAVAESFKKYFYLLWNSSKR